VPAERVKKMSRLVTILAICAICYYLHTIASYLPPEGKAIAYGIATLASLYLLADV